MITKFEEHIFEYRKDEDEYCYFCGLADVAAEWAWENFKKEEGTCFGFCPFRNLFERKEIDEKWYEDLAAVYCWRYGQAIWRAYKEGGTMLDIQIAVDKITQRFLESEDE